MQAFQILARARWCEAEAKTCLAFEVGFVETAFVWAFKEPRRCGGERAAMLLWEGWQRSLLSEVDWHLGRIGFVGLELVLQRGCYLTARRVRDRDGSRKLIRPRWLKVTY